MHAQALLDLLQEQHLQFLALTLLPQLKPMVLQGQTAAKLPHKPCFQEPLHLLGQFLLLSQLLLVAVAVTQVLHW